MKGKINTWYVGPYNILRVISGVAYRLDFPVDLASVHQLFYVSPLKKYIGDIAIVVPLESVGMKDNLFYKNNLGEIPNCRFINWGPRKLFQWVFFWKNQLVEGVTQKAEIDTMTKYPHLFLSSPVQTWGNKSLLSNPLSFMSLN